MTLDARVETEAALASLAAAESQAASLEAGLSRIDDKLDALLAEMERGEYGGNVDEIKALMNQVSVIEAEAASSRQAAESVEAEASHPTSQGPETSPSPPPQSQRSNEERQKEKQEHDALLDMMG